MIKLLASKFINIKLNTLPFVRTNSISRTSALSGLKNYSTKSNSKMIENESFMNLDLLNKFFSPKPITSTKVLSMHMTDTGFDEAHGFIKGGSILSRIDLVATQSVRKLGGLIVCPTRSMDAIHFLAPVKKGSLLTFKSQITRTWNTSMEIAVTVEVDNFIDNTPKLCCYSLLTFVMVKGPRDNQGKLRLPELYPIDARQKERFEQAQQRRSHRITNSKSHSKDLENLKRFLMFDHRASTMSTYAEMSHTVLPTDTNNIDSLFGGKIMNWMESCASISASRHSRGAVVSASSDAIQFVKPTRLGDVLILRSCVTQTFNSSLEVYVIASKLGVGTDIEEFTNDGFFTFVALDSKTDKPITKVQSLPQDIPEQVKNVGQQASSRRSARLEDLAKLIPPKL